MTPTTTLSRKSSVVDADPGRRILVFLFLDMLGNEKTSNLRAWPVRPQPVATLPAGPRLVPSLRAKRL